MCPRWSLISSSMATSREDLNRRSSGRRTRSRARPIKLAAVSLTSTEMNTASSTKPEAAPMIPPRITASGSLPPATSRAIRPVTGRIIRARRFQTPVTMIEVEMSRREKPQDRKAA